MSRYTAYAVQRNSDRAYVEAWPTSDAPFGKWCDDPMMALHFLFMTAATTEALEHMPPGSDWIVVPVHGEPNNS